MRARGAARSRTCAANPTTVVHEDVVGVETVEAALQRLARQRRVGEHAHPVEPLKRVAPLLVGLARRVVHVDVTDPEAAELEQRVDDRLGRPARHGSTWSDTSSPAATAAAATGRSRASSTDPGPHHETTTLSIPAPAISRICARDDDRIRRRVRAAGRVERRPHRPGRHVLALAPVLPAAVPERCAVPGVVEDPDARWDDLHRHLPGAARLRSEQREAHPQDDRRTPHRRADPTRVGGRTEARVAERPRGCD